MENLWELLAYFACVVKIVSNSSYGAFSVYFLPSKFLTFYKYLFRFSAIFSSPLFWDFCEGVFTAKISFPVPTARPVTTILLCSVILSLAGSG